MDVAKINTVEGELSAFVARRDKERRRDEGERAPEEIWQASVRVYSARRQQELCWEWLRWHQRMLNNHTKTSALITAHHQGEIQKYERMLNIDYQGGDAA